MKKTTKKLAWQEKKNVYIEVSVRTTLGYFGTISLDQWNGDTCAVFRHA